MRRIQARAVRVVLVLLVPALAGFLAAASLLASSASHDAQHPFAGNWNTNYATGDSGTLSLQLVTDGTGPAQLAAAGGVACTPPTDYYSGTESTSSIVGPVTASVIGCTYGLDGRSLRSRWHHQLGSGDSDITLSSDGMTFSGPQVGNHSAWSGTFAGHFAGDAPPAATTTPCRVPAGPTPNPNCPEEPPPAGPEELTPFRCRGQTATIIPDVGSAEIAGTDGRDVIVGTPGFDIIYAGGGDDLVCGRGGADQIYGGDGSDVLYGEGGEDNLQGENGRDRLDGGADGDQLSGGDDRDTFNGGPGNDRLQGGQGPDGLVGGPGNDTLDGGDGGEITGLTGRFVGDQVDYSGSRGKVSVDLANGRASGEGSDKLIGIEGVYGSPYADVLYGSVEQDTLYGDDSEDLIYGRAGDDYIDGGLENDRVLGGAGEDVLRGDSGDDVLVGGTGSDEARGGRGIDSCAAERRRDCERIAVGPGVVG